MDSTAQRRRSICVPEFDYASPGHYAVTICVQGRECLFGDVVDDVMAYTVAGLMVDTWWTGLTRRFPMVRVDEHIVMPNHLHGILEIVPDFDDNDGDHIGSPLPNPHH